MPPVPIPWPTSALPGRRPGEGQGDLINCYAAKIGDTVQIRRTPGLKNIYQLADASVRVPRGMLPTRTHLIHVWDDEVWRMSPSGAHVRCIGSLPGLEPVTMAANMRETPAQDVAIVTDTDAYILNMSTNTIEAYPDPLGNLGDVDSVEFHSGYFVFTKLSGQFIASDVNSSDIPDLSFASAQYAADPLLRAKSAGAVLLLFGSRSTEVWVDVGTMPFPFQRQTTLDVGLLGRWCVAGGSNEWGAGILFVGNDYTVRRMDGLAPQVVSTDDVSTDIFNYRNNAEAIRAQVYNFDQQAIWSISTPSWTWEFNVATSAWHRRESYGHPFWRASHATQFRMRWLAQDELEAKLFEILPGYYQEDTQRLRYRLESAPIKSFPASMRVPNIEIDCTVALGEMNVPSPYQTNPTAEIAWSHDGGANWSRPVTRSFGREGRYGTKVGVNNLGRSTHHGTRIRVDVTDPVPVVITGGVSTRLKPSRQRQVDK